MEIHKEKSEYAGKEIVINATLMLGEFNDPDKLNGKTMIVEDWADRVFGESWGDMNGNPTALKYAMRAGLSGVPFGNEVLYGKVDGLAHLIHISEVGKAKSL